MRTKHTLMLMCKHFFLQSLRWIMRKSSDAIYSFVRSILRDWRDFFSQKKVKKINPKVNIIFVTVCSESEHAKAVMRLKPSGYLTKEATNAQVLEELQNLRYPVA